MSKQLSAKKPQVRNKVMIVHFVTAIAHETVTEYDHGLSCYAN